MWKLVIEDDEGKRTVVPLTREDYTVGRQEGNTIRLTERNVSRRHAKLTRKQDGNGSRGFLLEDLASYNGVYVNGLRVSKTHDLVHGDLVQIGDYRIIMQDDAVVEPPTAVPAPFDPKQTIPQGPAVRGSLLMDRPNRLVMLAGPTPGAEYALDRERLTVGRAEDTNISINHNSVSRLHCEIHALGEGRYEIVDKGSSNGVRVNGAELKRGIIEAGDVIELGDVRFKFVGAGQIFIPGTGDSQQLQAIGDRVPVVDARRPGSIVPYMVFGAVVAAGAIGIWAFMHHQRQQEPQFPSATQAAPDALELERPILADAKHLCIEQNDCETAHDKLHVSIRSTSPLRESADFQEIESKWAEGVLARAEVEPDTARRKALYTSVVQNQWVSADKRQTATNKLLALDELSVNPNQLPVAKDAGIQVPPKPDAGAVLKPRTTPTPGPTATDTPIATAVHPTTTASPTPSVKPPGAAKSDADKARELMLQGNTSAARQLLEGKVFAGRGNAEELRIMTSICKGPPRDQPCMEALKRYQP